VCAGKDAALGGTAYEAQKPMHFQSPPAQKGGYRMGSPLTANRQLLTVDKGKYYLKNFLFKYQPYLIIVSVFAGLESTKTPIL
jgi:hypothetical protein